MRRYILTNFTDVAEGALHVGQSMHHSCENQDGHVQGTITLLCILHSPSFFRSLLQLFLYLIWSRGHVLYYFLSFLVGWLFSHEAEKNYNGHFRCISDCPFLRCAPTYSIHPTELIVSRDQTAARVLKHVGRVCCIELLNSTSRRFGQSILRWYPSPTCSKNHKKSYKWEVVYNVKDKFLYRSEPKIRLLHFDVGI